MVTTEWSLAESSPVGTRMHTQGWHTSRLVANPVPVTQNCEVHSQAVPVPYPYDFSCLEK